jgi:hypothetical protein
MELSRVWNGRFRLWLGSDLLGSQNALGRACVPNGIFTAAP